MKQAITEIWEDELQVDGINENDDFFDLGGHSLIMARIQSKLKTVLDIEVSMEELFENSTISKLVDKISVSC